MSLEEPVDSPVVSRIPSTVSEPAGEQCLSSTPGASAKVALNSGSTAGKPAVDVDIIPSKPSSRAAAAALTLVQSRIGPTAFSAAPEASPSQYPTSTLKSDWDSLRFLNPLPKFVQIREAIFFNLHNRYPKSHETPHYAGVHIDNVVEDHGLRLVLDDLLHLGFPFPSEALLTYGVASHPDDAASNYGAALERSTLVWRGTTVSDTLSTWEARSSSLLAISLGSWNILAALHAIKRPNAWNLQWRGSVSEGISLKIRSIDAFESLLSVLRLYNDGKGETGPLYPKAYIRDFGERYNMPGIVGTPQQFDTQWRHYISDYPSTKSRAYVLLHSLSLDFRVQHSCSRLEDSVVPYVYEWMLFDFLSSCRGITSLVLVGGPYYDPVGLFRTDFVRHWYIPAFETITKLVVEDMPCLSWFCLVEELHNLKELWLVNSFSVGRHVGAPYLQDPGYIAKFQGCMYSCCIERLYLMVPGLDSAPILDQEGRRALFWLIRSIARPRHTDAEVNRRRVAYGQLFGSSTNGEHVVR